MFNLIALEHLHPLIVHFPVALWLVGSLCYVASLLGYLRFFETPSLVMGVLGCLSGWGAKESGETAAKIVGDTLCHPTLLASHSQEMETAFIFYLAAWIFALLIFALKTRYVPKLATFWWLKGLVSVGLMLGSVFLVMGAHKGFQLVYEHGVAVKTPSTLCAPPAALENSEK